MEVHSIVGLLEYSGDVSHPKACEHKEEKSYEVEIAFLN
jgi:hypothetical protein